MGILCLYELLRKVQGYVPHCIPAWLPHWSSHQVQIAFKPSLLQYKVRVVALAELTVCSLSSGHLRCHADTVQGDSRESVDGHWQSATVHCKLISSLVPHSVWARRNTLSMCMVPHAQCVPQLHFFSSSHQSMGGLASKNPRYITCAITRFNGFAN